MDIESNNPSGTNWKQVYSLLALNAAIVISWIAYHNYQPKILELFHFQQLTLFLVVAQAAILVLIPGLGDVASPVFSLFFVWHGVRLQPPLGIAHRPHPLLRALRAQVALEPELVYEPPRLLEWSGMGLSGKSTRPEPISHPYPATKLESA